MSVLDVRVVGHGHAGGTQLFKTSLTTLQYLRLKLITMSGVYRRSNFLEGQIHILIIQRPIQISMSSTGLRYTAVQDQPHNPAVLKAEANNHAVLYLCSNFLEGQIRILVIQRPIQIRMSSFNGTVHQFYMGSMELSTAQESGLLLTFSFFPSLWPLRSIAQFHDGTVSFQVVK